MFSNTLCNHSEREAPSHELKDVVQTFNSLNDIRRQSELLSPQELKDFVQNSKRRPSLLEEQKETCQCCTWTPKAKAYKNLLGAGLSFMLVVSAMIALVSLQSSLNSEGGLGIASLAITNGVFLVSGLFNSSIIYIFGTKYTALISIVFFSVFSLLNYYPQWYTLVPGAVCLGLGLGTIFSSLNVHMTTTALRYAKTLKETPEYIVSLFLSILAMFSKLSYIPGNLATTIILFSEQAQVSNNSDDTGIIDTSLGSVCNNTEAATLDPLYVYMLISFFVLLDLLAIIICLTLMDHLGTETRFRSWKNAFKIYFNKPIIATIKMFADWKIYMIFTMMLLDGFLSSFVLGIFAKTYVSDCIGVHWIGLVVMPYGICSGLSAVTGGRLVKCIPQFIIVYVTGILSISVVLFLLLWKREPSYIVPFITIPLLGMTEGIWHSIPPSLVGILFPTKKEPAFSVIRMGLATGYLVGFSMSLFLKTQVLLWIAFSLIILSLITYSILVFKTLTKEQLFPCCSKIEKNEEAEINENHTPKISE